MPGDVQITYTNQSMNLDQPKVFLFTRNEIPTFDSLKNGVAWKVIERVGRGSSCVFPFPEETEICASWNNGTCSTIRLKAFSGQGYCVSRDETGIVLLADGNGANPRSLDVRNDVHVPNGVSVDLYKDGRIMMSEKIVAYDQKATFVVHPKLYWGLASEIQEGETIGSAVLNSSRFFELDLEGMSNVVVGLHGNAEDGYRFRVESKW
ncbi:MULTISPECIES: hypothetical protein [Anaerotruncus]|jgi:hypothetical protein|uniref:hypothetical protein n=1 Tax=Anaerotruncus TaxID=244127 RepID=UPI000C787595|nr:hypothetical protein [Anaerotruncus massiliensis (ex Togo et al. 2019)]GKH45685.1 hypothetical protein CE91St45_02470 [Oscillospiraceae bacterium]